MFLSAFTRPACPSALCAHCISALHSGIDFIGRERWSIGRIASGRATGHWSRTVLRHDASGYGGRTDSCGSFRIQGKDANKYDVLARGRKSIAVDLKSEAGVETVLKLVESADVLLEGFRPGVTERLGLGPDVCLARNPALVYGRMTGWGQYGSMAHAAGHDINYISLSGVLHGIGEPGGKPTPP